jgi:hypothetical protein
VSVSPSFVAQTPTARRGAPSMSPRSSGTPSQYAYDATVRGATRRFNVAPTAFATIECLPSAPTTRRARSKLDDAAPFSRRRTPATAPPSVTSSSTTTFSRTSAPASRAAATSVASSSVRRGL